MFPFDFSKYKKALVLGTGGGNDIVSATLIALYLQNQGLETDVAGMLSPVARHIFDGQIEKEINLVSSNTLRCIDFPENSRKVSFIDRCLPNANLEESLRIGEFYNFSLKFGTERLERELSKLIEKEKYDVFIGVDVGGDVLGRHGKDKYILSPMMDFTSLRLLGMSTIDSFLVEFGLLTDGENRQGDMDEILNELQEGETVLGESRLDQNEEEIERFTKLYFKHIQREREGGTIPRLFKTLNEKRDIHIKNRIIYKILPKVWESYHDLILPERYAGRILLLDGKKLAEKRSILTNQYDNPLEQFVRIKAENPLWKTEADLLYMWCNEDWTTQERKGKSLFLLTPSEQVPDFQRNKIISYGLGQSKSDMILLYKSDIDHIKDSRLFVFECGRFSLISYEDSFEERRIARQIKGYQTKL